MVPRAQDPAGPGGASRGSPRELRLERAGMAETWVVGPGATRREAPAWGRGRVWPRHIPEDRVTGEGEAPPSLPVLAWSPIGSHLPSPGAGVSLAAGRGPRPCPPGWLCIPLFHKAILQFPRPPSAARMGPDGYLAEPAA